MLGACTEVLLWKGGRYVSGRGWVLWLWGRVPLFLCFSWKLAGHWDVAKWMKSKCWVKLKDYGVSEMSVRITRPDAASLCLPLERAGEKGGLMMRMDG